MRRRRSVALAMAVLAGALVTACTSEDAPTLTAPTEGMSLAQCRPYGVPSAPVTLKLPGMVFHVATPIDGVWRGAAYVALRAYVDEPPGSEVTTSATLFGGPPSSARDQVQDGMWEANLWEHSQWGVDTVAKNAIKVSPAADTTQATNVSHSTFTTRHRTVAATFDYWAFTSSGQRYLLSYTRRPTVKTPDAAAFFKTATSCPK